MLWVKRVYGDRRVSPNGIEDLLLAQESARVSQQQEHHAEGPWLHGQRFPRLDEREVILPHLKAAESENKGLSLHHNFIMDI